MRQTRKASLIETISSTAFGFGVAILANYFVLPLWGFKVTAMDSFAIAVVFTVISIVRGYVFRRCFEYLRVSGILP